MTNVVKTASRLFHQGRHLRLVQLYARARHRIIKPRIQPLAEPPGWNAPSAPWVEPAPMPHRMLGNDSYRILGQERTLRFPAAWSDQSLGRKWLMELHAFHFLRADSTTGAGLRPQTVVEDWFRHSRPGEGPGWHPYIIGNRISNWLAWSLSAKPLTPPMRASIAQQTDYLRQVLEYDELDHKLLNNAKALLFAGLCLQTPAARHWRARARGLIARYCIELLGDDGGYTGLSPMYHSTLLNDLLDVTNLLRAFGEQPIPGLESAVGAARYWLSTLCHPDGQFALFNDAAFEVVAVPAELDAYARRLGLPGPAEVPQGLLHLADSGFARLSFDSAVALVDTGRIGPDHAPSHGHADTLTFELSIHGRRVVVDTGLSTYETMPERLQQRETAAHNTLVLDGRNSSDVWGRFKVGRRAAVLDLVCEQSTQALHIGAAHDGYRQRGNPILHRRDWTMTRTDLRIRDQVTGSGSHRAEVAFHLHPDVRVAPASDNCFELHQRNGPLLCRLELDPEAAVAVEEYAYHPQFDLSLPAVKLVARRARSLPLTLDSRFIWQPGP